MALINATAHNRCSSIPIGNSFQKSPTNLTSADPNKVTAMQIQFCRAFLRMMDEHSMNSRAMFAWLLHRCKEARRPLHIIVEEGNILVHRQSSLPQEVFSWPWGGFNFVYTIGDNAQLPPVFQKPMYSEESDWSNMADNVGRIVVSDFLTGSTDNTVKSSVVVMYQVLRQDDTSFLDLLERMADGTLESADVGFVVGKCLDKATKNIRQSLAQAKHLVSTWKMAHPIIIMYLNKMLTQVAKINAQYQSILSSGITNHCVKGPLPKRLANVLVQK